MPVKLEDRPIEQVREEAVDKLIVNYSHAIISAEAFERRLDEAMASNSHQHLVDLVSDLPMEADKRYDASKERSFSPKYAAGDNTEDDKIISILGNGLREGEWLVPKRIKVIDILGSSKLDFTDAIFQHQHIEIELATVLGSVEIFVPESVNVTVKMFNIIGSSENSAPSMAGRQAPHITITGYSVLGSLDVKVKRTMKEKFVAFANNLREALGLEQKS
ncbi:LiaF domain-containing protein [Pseudidiomarina mangrovi]|uniref:LiaF domain-containing protein n=1 Tax=Pseudidiomarina mangrovi TaxID=2487133 RepID=UPI000FCC5293|nr:LiaF domain-containing protein [Pseudidiomarina mangrovi]